MLCLLGPVGVSHIGRAELAFQEPRRKDEGSIGPNLLANRLASWTGSKNSIHRILYVALQAL